MATRCKIPGLPIPGLPSVSIPPPIPGFDVPIPKIKLGLRLPGFTFGLPSIPFPPPIPGFDVPIPRLPACPLDLL